MNQREYNLILGILTEALFVLSVIISANTPPFTILSIPLTGLTILFGYGLFIYFPIALSNDRLLNRKTET